MDQDRAKSSSAFQWDTDRPEEFRDFNRIYDIREAKRIIVAKPRPVKEWSTSSAYREIFEDALESTRLKQNIDFSSIDDDLPLILVREPDGGIVIDGHHRLRKRMDREAETVPVVILEEEETERIRTIIRARPAESQRPEARLDQPEK